MDKAILKKFAIESRKDLMEKIKNKIKTFYVDEEFEKEQKGELYILSNEKHSLSLTNEEYQKRELLIKRIKELSLEQVIEEAAYTWFNRIIAIRYMEIHDYLPLTKDNQSLGIRVLSSKDNTPDPEILKFTNLMNPDLDIDFKKEKFAELKDNNEKFKYVLLLVCKKLGRVIPQVFDGVTDYIDILIPDNLLNDTGFVAKIIKDIPKENYKSVEIIGWLYQYYNQNEKDRVMAQNRAYKKEEIPFVTQLFTPDWIVKYMVENSLGRYWVEHNGDGALYSSDNLYSSNSLYSSSSITDNWKYFIKENIENKKDKLNPTEITFIDPCCGSGHILVYAFEVFYQIYLQAGYNKKDIPKFIIKNNLYGLDIDDRAVQLTILSVLLKAREFDKDIFNKGIEKILNIISIQGTDVIKENVLNNLKTEEAKTEAKYLLNIFKNAKEIGSLIIIENKDYDILENEINKNDTIFGIELKNKFFPLIEQAKMLSNKYDIVVTNPPYMGQSYMPVYLKKYINKYYCESKFDLCTAFMQNNLVKNDGLLSMINQHSWMFLSSFEKLRYNIINNKTIINMIHLGTRAFEEIGGEVVQTTAFVIKNSASNNNTIFIRLVNYEKAELKETKFLENLKTKKDLFYRNIKDFMKIPGFSMAYWISDKIIKPFSNCISIDEISRYTGSQNKTANNEKYLRNIWEVNNTKIGKNKKWVFYAKGGEYRKHYGNIDLVIDWSNEARNFYLKNPTSNLLDKSLWYKDGITYTMLTTRGNSFRYLPVNCVFDMGGPSICYLADNLFYVLAFLNTNLAAMYLGLFNPTINLQVKDVKALPLLINKEKKDYVSNLEKECIEISKQDWDSFETSWDFKKHPLLEFIDSMPGLHDTNIKVPPRHLKIIKNNYGEDCFIANELPIKARISDSFKRWKEYTERQFNKLKQNEEELNKIFIDIYGLQGELTPVEEDKDVTIRKADRVRDIKSLISYAVGCMFGRYSLDKEGLIYAGGDFDEVYKKYKSEDGGYAGASQTNYTILIDNGKEINLSFEVDNDNVIPITDEAYFKDDIVERFKKLISVVYGKETLNENLDFIAETLGKKGTETSEDAIRRYFVNDFFNDHVKIYQKRPIYWLLDSGKKNGFKALIYMHRYNEDLIPKIRINYLHRMQNAYEKLLSEVNYKLTLDLSMTDKKEAQKRQTDLNAKLQEIREYDEKIAHIANQRRKIDLDDGVKVNYGKFQDILAKIK